jgi:endonuclease YncB( thermonuclease family)
MPLYKISRQVGAENLNKKIIIRRFIKLPMYGIVVVLLIAITLGWHLHDLDEQVFKSSLIDIIDGDTIILNNLKIRLQGIDAPEMKQTCKQRIDGKIWPCGLAAAEKLKALTAGKEIACTNEGKDKYQRHLSYCYVGDLNINAEMVKQGYAIAYTRYDKSFILEEWQARWYNRGVWASEFIEPSSWRGEYNNKRRS